jgi:hypothetical protein
MFPLVEFWSGLGVEGLLEFSVVRVRGGGLGVRILDTVDGSSVILYPDQVRWLCTRRLLPEGVCFSALKVLELASEGLLATSLYEDREPATASPR